MFGLAGGLIGQGWAAIEASGVFCALSCVVDGKLRKAESSGLAVCPALFTVCQSVVILRVLQLLAILFSWLSRSSFLFLYFRRPKML